MTEPKPIYIEYDEWDEAEIPTAIAPCDLESGDIITIDFSRPLLKRVVTVERKNVIVYEVGNNDR